MVGHEATRLVVPDVICAFGRARVGDDFRSAPVEEHDGGLVVKNMDGLADVVFADAEVHADDGNRTVFPDPSLNAAPGGEHGGVRVGWLWRGGFGCGVPGLLRGGARASRTNSTIRGVTCPGLVRGFVERNSMAFIGPSADAAALIL